MPFFFCARRPPPWDGSNALPPPPQTPTPFCSCFLFCFGSKATGRTGGPDFHQGRLCPLRPCREARDGPHRGQGGGRGWEVWGEIIRAVQRTADHGGPRVGASAKECTRQRDERGGKGQTPMAKGSGARPGASPHQLRGGSPDVNRDTPSELLVFGHDCRDAGTAMMPLSGAACREARCFIGATGCRAGGGAGPMRAL